MYKQALAPGQVSDPVFSSVTIKENISDADFAWLAGIVMDHTDECYEYIGVHDGKTYDADGNEVVGTPCVITYKHHDNCVLSKAATAGVLTALDVAGAEKGDMLTGTDSEEYTCDCTPAEQHVEGCPALVGTLKAGCGHTAPAGAISGFRIKTQGSAVQAKINGMDTWDDTDTIAALLALYI